MRYAVTEDMAFLRLSDGEELHRSIATACEEYSMDSAVIIGGLGMASEIVFGWYTGQEYIKERLEGTFEVASLSGDISTGKVTLIRTFTPSLTGWTIGRSADRSQGRNFP